MRGMMEVPFDLVPRSDCEFWLPYPAEVLQLSKALSAIFMHI